MALGRFTGVGIGPGDPELLTLKAQKALSSAQVIFVPKAKISDEGLALQILMNSVVAKTGAEVVELVFPMSKDPEVLRPAWEEALEAVLAQLRAGKNCAFITLGDTAIYSTYMNLLALLRRDEPGLAMQTVAGISAFSEAAARLNLSLVEKDETMAVLPCLTDVRKLKPELERFDTVVLMKVGKRFADLRELLKQMGLLQHSHLALKLGSPGELVTSDLEAVDPALVTYMSVVIVRKPPSGSYT